MEQLLVEQYLFATSYPLYDTLMKISIQYEVRNLVTIEYLQWDQPCHPAHFHE